MYLERKVNGLGEILSALWHITFSVVHYLTTVLLHFRDITFVQYFLEIFQMKNLRSKNTIFSKYRQCCTILEIFPMKSEYCTILVTSWKYFNFLSNNNGNRVFEKFYIYIFFFAQNLEAMPVKLRQLSRLPRYRYTYNYKPFPQPV